MSQPHNRHISRPAKIGKLKLLMGRIKTGGYGWTGGCVRSLEPFCSAAPTRARGAETAIYRPRPSLLHQFLVPFVPRPGRSAAPASSVHRTDRGRATADRQKEPRQAGRALQPAV